MSWEINNETAIVLADSINSFFYYNCNTHTEGFILNCLCLTVFPFLFSPPPYFLLASQPSFSIQYSPTSTNPICIMSIHCSPALLHHTSSYPLHSPLFFPRILSFLHPTPLIHLPLKIGTPPPTLGSSISSSIAPPLPLVFPPSPGLVSTAVVSEGQMTGELAPGRALSHPGAIRPVANNRCFRPGEDQSGGIMGNVRSSAFYTSAQMDEITLVSF